jgi:hypothetical protein
MTTSVKHEEEFDEVEIGLPEKGVPMPRQGGFLGKLRRAVERLEVGMSLTLTHVTWKQEKYIRQRLPGVGRDLQSRYSIRVMDNARDRTGKRTLRVYRTE